MGLAWQQGPLFLDGVRLRLEPGQSVIPHGLDRDLDVDEIAGREPARQGSLP